MNEKIFVPPLKIQGIKTKIVPLIKKYIAINDETLWIEPFMGSGVVGFNVKPRRAIFADINPFIIDFYSKIQSKEINSSIIFHFLNEHGKILAEKGEEYYYSVRERFNLEHNPLDFLFLNRSCFNGMVRFNKSYEFNVPYGHKPERFSKAYVTKIINQVKYVEQCLSECEWTFVKLPFEITIKKFSTSNSFIYCDPPYIGRHVDYYDSWDKKSEIALRDILLESGSRFMLSTWEHSKYRENECVSSIWGFCNKITTEHFYFVGGKEDNRNPITEALLINYEPHLGTNDVIYLTLKNENRQLRLF